MPERRFSQKLRDLEDREKQAGQEIEQEIEDRKAMQELHDKEQLRIFNEKEKEAKKLVPIVEKNLSPLLKTLNRNYFNRNCKIETSYYVGPAAKVELYSYGEDENTCLELLIGGEHNIFFRAGKEDHQFLGNLNDEEWKQNAEDAIIDSLEKGSYHYSVPRARHPGDYERD